MVDEEKLKNIQKALTDLIPNDAYKISTEKGRIVYQKQTLLSTIILIYLSGIFYFIHDF